MKFNLITLFLIISLLFSKISSSQPAWSKINFDKKYILTKVYFLNEHTGFIVGTFRINENTIRTRLFKTTNSGISFDTLLKSENMSSTSFSDINFFDSNTGLLIANKIYKTTNGGNNWSINDPTLSSHSSIKVFDNNNCYIIGSQDGSNNAGICKSTNRGENWSIINGLLNPSSVNSFDFYDLNNGFTNNNGNGSYTSNGGITWTGTPISIPNPHTLKLINTQTMYGMYGRNFVRTDNRWNNFSAHEIPLVQFTHCMYFWDENSGVTVGMGGNRAIFSKTTNGGLNWNSSYLGNNDFGHMYSIQFINSMTGYCVGDSGKIYKTNNGGVNVKLISSIINSSFELYQNFPNPFNPITKIKFTISKANYTRLKIFDINGKEIEELFEGNLGRGTYEINFIGDKYPSGVYYYKLLSNNFQETKKMILLK